MMTLRLTHMMKELIYNIRQMGYKTSTGSGHGYFIVYDKNDRDMEAYLS